MGKHKIFKFNAFGNLSTKSNLYIKILDNSSWNTWTNFYEQKYFEILQTLFPF